MVLENPYEKLLSNSWRSSSASSLRLHYLPFDVNMIIYAYTHATIRIEWQTVVFDGCEDTVFVSFRVNTALLPCDIQYCEAR